MVELLVFDLNINPTQENPVIHQNERSHSFELNSKFELLKVLREDSLHHPNPMAYILKQIKSPYRSYDNPYRFVFHFDKGKLLLSSQFNESFISNDVRSGRHSTEHLFDFVNAVIAVNYEGKFGLNYRYGFGKKRNSIYFYQGEPRFGRLKKPPKYLIQAALDLHAQSQEIATWLDEHGEKKEVS